MKLRGRLVDVGAEREVDTEYGSRSLAEVTVRIDSAETDRPAVGDATARLTLWGKWTHTVEHAEPGMELLATDLEASEYRGETGYATTGDSRVVLEPGFLVDVTDIRSWVQCPRMYYLNKLSGIP